MNFILIPLMTALFAWLLTWSFVKLLFFPYHPIKLFGYKWEGACYPLIQQLSLDKFLGPDQIGKKLDQVMPFIDSKLDDFFRNKIGEKLPMISMFIGDKTIAQLKAVFLEELSNLFPSLITQFSQSLEADFKANYKQKMAPAIEIIIMKATVKLRIAAFTIGLLWGLLTYYIISLF